MRLPVGVITVVIGLTMIKVNSGQERMVYASLQKRPEIRDVYRLFGEYSFFLVMQAEEKDDIRRMLGDIKSRESVIKTGPILVTKDGWSRDRAVPAVA